MLGGSRQSGLRCMLASQSITLQRGDVSTFVRKLRATDLFKNLKCRLWSLWSHRRSRRLLVWSVLRRLKAIVREFGQVVSQGQFRCIPLFVFGSPSWRLKNMRNLGGYRWLSLFGPRFSPDEWVVIGLVYGTRHNMHPTAIVRLACWFFNVSDLSWFWFLAKADRNDML